MGTQAIVMHPELLSKVKRWALEHDAWVPYRRQDGSGGGGSRAAPPSHQVMRAWGTMDSAAMMDSCDAVEMRSRDLNRDQTLNQAEAKNRGQGDEPVPALRGSIEYRRYREVVDREAAAAAKAGGGPVKWSGIKALRRAVEKAVRSYRHDSSRLMDIVRQSLVFADLQSLTRCLEDMVQDPEVQLVQIKNRMDPECDSRASSRAPGPFGSQAPSAGYRDVCVSLRLLTPAVVAAGAWGHVCEVQLMLLSVAQVKTAEGHARYVAFRNIRGE